MQHYQPVSLLSFETAGQALGRVFGRRRAMKFSMGNDTISIRPVARQFGDEIHEKRYALECQSGGERVELYVSQQNMDLLVLRREPGLVLQDIPVAALPLVLEFIFEGLIRNFENMLGSRHIITDCYIINEPPHDPNFFFEIFIDNLSISVAGHFCEPHLHRLRHWALSLPRDKPRNLRTEIAFRIGAATLTTQQLKSLRVGDGIVLSVGAEEKWFAVVGEKYLAPVIRREGSFELTGPLLVEPLGPMRQMMNNELYENTADEMSIEGDVGEVPIKVVFNAGRLTIPMAELEDITVGHIFEVKTPQENSIEIVAQGVVIGRGRLVTVNGLTAVQVTAINLR